MSITAILGMLVSLLVGAGIGVFIQKSNINTALKSAQAEQEKKLLAAENKAKEKLLEAKKEALKMQDSIKQEERKQRQEFQKTERRLLEKEKTLDSKIEKAEIKKGELEKKIEDLQKRELEVSKMAEEKQAKLESVANLSKEEAKEVLIKQVEADAKADIMSTMKKAEQEIKDEVDQKARFMIAEALAKYAGETTMESTITTIQIPSDDMKGRIIGKEGRNITTFERETGVDVIVDDTPGSISISCFDLLRRYIAKAALTKLVADGRIHPARIEEVVAKTKEEVNILIKELGEKALFEAGVVGLHPDLVKLLGRLKFRVSEGNNVLKHSIEVSFLAANLASELGADIEVCKKAGLLHDIGKAVDHEIQGHHSFIGRDLLKKFGLSKEVIHCVESHHDLIEPTSLEAKVVQAANLIAKSRPGAQKDNLSNFIRRLSELENLVNEFEGVKKCYAVQTGKQARVFVDPTKIDDLGAMKLSREIAKKVEKQLKYPGQIKVMVIRENRTEAYAT